MSEGYGKKNAQNDKKIYMKPDFSVIEKFIIVMKNVP